jgi:hypothetical protein
MMSEQARSLRVSPNNSSNADQMGELYCKKSNSSRNPASVIITYKVPSKR